MKPHQRSPDQENGCYDHLISQEKMLQFIGDNKRLLHFHEQKLSDLEAFKSNTQVFQKNTSASLKNLETQVGQLALSMPNQSKGTFPSDTQKNPKDCMTVQLRSGKEVGNNSKKERKEETDVEQEDTGKEEKKSMPEKTTEAKKKIQTDSLKEVVSRNRRRRYQLIHLQCHSPRGFRKQKGKSSFLDSWTSSRRQKSISHLQR